MTFSMRKFLMEFKTRRDIGQCHTFQWLFIIDSNHLLNFLKSMNFLSHIKNSKLKSCLIYAGDSVALMAGFSVHEYVLASCKVI